ncbi:hypothetical protein GC722_11750 [Auraticoccus sp. F435]|uniref:Uncharacterized protein n=1 Tax=Auraticoccus cholistanensis TaxID=2656650 RepID=A0A6A9UVG7_9ACTN|nr:hypothetical protein [Auraticoccus cholistanensis]MVA76691.1 hypothetical protein [Auraticoccus cholistanensis]
MGQQSWPAVPPGGGPWWGVLQGWDAELQRAGRVELRSTTGLRAVAVVVAVFGGLLCLSPAVALPVVFGGSALVFATVPLLLCTVLFAVVAVQQMRLMRRHLVVTVEGIEVTGLATVPWRDVLAARTYLDAVQVSVATGTGTRWLKVGTLQAPAAQVVAWLELVRQRMLSGQRR